MPKRFENAIVLTPCPAMIDGITTANLGVPDYELALEQHRQYISALEACGLAVKVLKAEPNQPDSTFIEDVALCTPNCAIITSPGALSRRAELAGKVDVLKLFYQNIETITLPGTLEAGDVMMVGDHYYIGLSDRTNRQGADQLTQILSKYGMSASQVTLSEMLHLKTGVSYLENNNLLVSGEFIDHLAFQSFTKLVVPENENIAANALWINGKVLLPQGNPQTRAMIEKSGYETIVLDISEFQKLDGGLSCLSLRF